MHGHWHTLPCTHTHTHAFTLQAVRNLNPLICRFYFMDNKAKAMGVSASATANDVIKILSQKIDLQSVDGWALYEVRDLFQVPKLARTEEKICS